VHGPSAPTERRTIGALLRDPAVTTLRRLPLAGLSLGATASVGAFAEGEFRVTRDAAGVGAEAVGANFDPRLLAEGRLRAQFSDGASSSFFARGLDNSLVVKTITGSEAEVLLRLLPAYLRHLRDNPASLLCRFYGAFSLALPGLARVYFVLMSNVFPIPRALPGAVAFDLKGSTVNRFARVSRGGGAASKGAMLWQDNEFRERLPRGVPVVDGDALVAMAEGSAGPPPVGAPWSAAGDADLAAGAPRARAIVYQLQRDVTLLASQGLMDYSLLLQVVPLACRAGGEGAGGEGAGGTGFGGGPAPLALRDAAALVKSTGQSSARASHLAVSLCALGYAVGAEGGGSGDGGAGAGVGAAAGGEGSAPSSPRPMPAFQNAARALLQVGVVDVLQFFDTSKRLENAYKQLARGPTANISAVDPNAYAVRFMEFASAIFSPNGTA
jgi:hypothetical protein